MIFSVTTFSVKTLSTKGLFETLSIKGLFETLGIKGLFATLSITTPY